MTAIAAIVMSFILFVAGNAMAQSIRERTNELAVLKTLGFGEGRILALVLMESLRRSPSSAGAWASWSPGCSSRRAIRPTACCRRSIFRFAI